MRSILEDGITPSSFFVVKAKYHLTRRIADVNIYVYKGNV